MKYSIFTENTIVIVMIILYGNMVKSVNMKYTKQTE
jgi:hypothetical protein